MIVNCSSGGGGGGGGGLTSDSNELGSRKIKQETHSPISGKTMNLMSISRKSS